MTDISHNLVNNMNQLESYAKEDYTKFIDYIVRLYFFDKTYIDGSITHYGPESITLKLKENNKKFNNYNRSLILDLKVLNIPKATNKSNKKNNNNSNNTSNNKKGNNNGNKNDTSFGMIDINSIKKSDFNFEDSNSKYEYNRTELKSQSNDDINYNDEERNDLVLNKQTLKLTEDGKKKDSAKLKKSSKANAKQEKKLKAKQLAKAMKQVNPEEENVQNELSSIENEKTSKKKQSKKKAVEPKVEIVSEFVADSASESDSNEDNISIDIDSLPITKSINLSHICDLLNSESIKRQKLKKKLKKKKQSVIKKIEQENIEDDDDILKNDSIVEMNDDCSESALKPKKLSTEIEDFESINLSSSSYELDASDNECALGDNQNNLLIEETLASAKKNVEITKKRGSKKENTPEAGPSSIDETLVMKILLEKAVKAGLLSKETADKQQLFNENTQQIEAKEEAEKLNKKKQQQKKKKQQQKKNKLNKQTNDALEVEATEPKEIISSKKKKNNKNKKKKSEEIKEKSKSKTPEPSAGEEHKARTQEPSVGEKSESRTPVPSAGEEHKARTPEPSAEEEHKARTPELFVGEEHKARTPEPSVGEEPVTL
ncbi:hypothetical protein QEN19_003367 [Hanseniaspora menglaensis]